MEPRSRFLFLLTGLSILTGYLLSKASWVGRAGISLFYKQYSFLKVWWQGALLVLAVWLLLFFLQGQAQQRLAVGRAKQIHVIAILLAAAGLFFTYLDFRNSTAHRWLGERFHLGGYLFWLGWVAISVFYLKEKKAAGQHNVGTGS